LCEQRQRLAWLIATYANGDGTSITAGVETWANALGLSRRAVTYLLDDLTELQLLQNGKLTRFNGTRTRTLDLESFATRFADAQSTPDAQSSNADAQSTRSHCAICALPDAQSSNADAQSSAFLAPIPPEDCAIPSVGPRETDHHPHRISDRQVEVEENSSSCSPFATQKAQPMDSENEPSEEEIEQSLKALAEIQWQEFIKKLPTDLMAATFLAGQRAAIEKMLEKYGAECLLLIIQNWIDNRALPLEERIHNRWGALLDEILPYIEPGRKEYKRKEREKAEQKYRADWNKLHADIKSRGRLDDAFLESRWSLGPQDRSSLADFKAAPFGFDMFETADMLARYDYWQAENAGTLVWDEKVTNDYGMVQEEKAGE
jgi:hypothetical protein